jgi:hypothetical protein
VSDYGLDDRAIEARSSTEVEDFSSSPCVQTSSGAHPASYPIDTERGKARPGRDADLSPSSSAENELRMSRSYTSSPPICLHGM